KKSPPASGIFTMGGSRISKARTRSIRRRWRGEVSPALPACQLLHGLIHVDIRHPLIRAIPLHACKSKRQTALIPRADLNLVKRDLDHNLRFDIDRVGIAPDLPLQQFLRLPFQHFVSEALKSLAEHGVAALFDVACAEMEIAEPTLPASVPPLR